MKKLWTVIAGIVCLALGFGLSCWLGPCKARNDGNKAEWMPGREAVAFIDRVVDAYDTFVRSRTGDDMTIEEAYVSFFAGLPEIESAGEVGDYMYDSVYLYGLVHEIISGQWEYNGLIQAKYNGPTEHRAAMWSIYPDWHMGPLLRVAAGKNTFWKETVESFEAAGDFTPSIVAGLLNGYEGVDFSNKLERFIVASIYLPAFSQSDSFIIPADSAKNDSVRKILKERYDNQRTD